MNNIKILKWEINPDLKRSTAEHYRARIHDKVKNSAPMDILHEVTFDCGAPDLTIDEIYRFIEYVSRNILSRKLCGVGMDVGGGPGTFSSIISLRPCVKKMYSVEVSENLVRDLMPTIAEFILGSKNLHKVIGCVGEFNNIELPDNSLDFVFDFFSLHHSPELDKTLKEINRVLKPDGFLLCFDKARDDSLTKADLEEMLDKEYSNEFKTKMGIDKNQKHTRRMNGENEYRLKDWNKYLMEAGFSTTEHFNVARTLSTISVVKLLKRIFSWIHPRLQVHITRFLPVKTTNQISAKNRIYTPLVNNFQKEISLIIGYK